MPIEAPSDESAFREMPHHERRSLWPSAVSARAAFFRERSHKDFIWKLLRRSFLAAKKFIKIPGVLVKNPLVLPAKTVDIFGFGQSATQEPRQSTNRDAMKRSLHNLCAWLLCQFSLL